MQQTESPIRRLAKDRDGLLTLALSTLVIAGSLGISLVLALVHVAVVALTSGAAPATIRRVVVLGQLLRPDGRPGPGYIARLSRAAALLERHPHADVVLLGGRTGRGHVSEAEAGRDHLRRLGIAASRIQMEDRSRHTLENLACYRALHAETPMLPVVIVSAPTHLGRAALMARSFAIPHRVCAAGGLGRHAALEILREALLVHWYVTGSLYARATGNARMNARIR